MTNTITRHTVLFDGAGPAIGEWFRIDAKYTDGDTRGIQGMVSGGGTVLIEGTTRENLGGPAFGQNILGSDTNFVPNQWIYTPNWSFLDGVANSDGSQTTGVSLTQANSDIQEGYTYTLTFTISSYVAGTVTPILSGTNGTVRSANGTYTETLVAGSQFPRLNLAVDSAFQGEISDVSLVLEVPADDIGILQQYNTDFTDVLNSGWTYIRVNLDAGTAKVQGLI
jgi:hypothetical protein